MNSIRKRPFQRLSFTRHGILRGTIGLFLLLSTALARQERNVVMIAPGDSPAAIVRKAATVAPSARQLTWQKLEFIAFIHFGMNTFMDQEWGKGTEDPRSFNPTDLDARQWVRVIRDAGMKLVIVTAKHHDGFCLWPSRYTDHSVKSSPWRGGKGDVVGDVANACREMGLKFGVYLSPWDRHEKTYGDSPVYNKHFLDQLRELLTDYGEVSEVWFDGANGEGPNGKRQIYDWQAYYRLIRKLQPNAVIAIMGPDVRWVGTESGYGRETEWSVVPDVTRNLQSIAAASQQEQVDGAFVPRDLMGEDLGGRGKLAAASTLAWYPAETDVSIRPGWFYHEGQDNLVKSPSKLVDIYYSSVGRNSVLLLNIPPDKRGRITDFDVRSLAGMRTVLDQTFRVNLAAKAHASATSESPAHRAEAAIDQNTDTYWTTAADVETATIEFGLKDTKMFDRAMLMENISVGQRVESFRLEAFSNGAWKEFARGTTIGYKRLLRFPTISTPKVRLVIERSRTNPTLSSFGLFKSPPIVTIEPPEGSFEKNLSVQLSCDTDSAEIYYTLDGTDPTLQSTRYTGPISLQHTAIIKAAAALGRELCAEQASGRFTQCLPVKSAAFEKPPSQKYPGTGLSAIIDGRRGSTDFQDKRWIGFNGDDVLVTLDLGAVKTVNEVSIGFLQQQGSWIFLPKAIKIAVSTDGENWKMLADIDNSVIQSESVFVNDFSCQVNGSQARFIKIRGTTIGICPSWHPGSGGKAWLFVDEVIVR
jgi:alpha-L-fucosidase